MSEKKIIRERFTGEIIEKKSRFIATLAPVQNEAEASCFIEEIKKKYWDAKHNCSAYVIFDDENQGIIVRSNDDKEPAGTAGRPMLEVLTKENLVNVVVVVTRYFGGILLGTGGLVRAYQGAVKEALLAADIYTVKKGKKYCVLLEYNDFDVVQKFFQNESFIMEKIEYSDKVTFEGIFPVEKSESALIKIKDITLGRAKCTDIGECDYFVNE